jgi:hypothetical protein
MRYDFRVSGSLPERGHCVTGCFDRVEVLGQTDSSLHLLCDGLPVDFVRYPYPPIEPPAVAFGVGLAGVRDLAVMKLAAISRRGLRRDSLGDEPRSPTWSTNTHGKARGRTGIARVWPFSASDVTSARTEATERRTANTMTARAKRPTRAATPFE